MLFPFQIKNNNATKLNRAMNDLGWNSATSVTEGGKPYFWTKRDRNHGEPIIQIVWDRDLNKYCCSEQHGKILFFGQSPTQMAKRLENIKK